MMNSTISSIVIGVSCQNNCNSFFLYAFNYDRKNPCTSQFVWVCKYLLDSVFILEDITTGISSVPRAMLKEYCIELTELSFFELCDSIFAKHFPVFLIIRIDR